MELLTFLSCSFIFLPIIQYCLVLFRKRNLPPGPNGVPIFGNLFDIGPNPHESLAKLAEKYGPLMTIRQGSVTTIVASSAEMAKEVLQKHDDAFSGRIIPDAITELDQPAHALAWLPTGGQWRRVLNTFLTNNVMIKQRKEITETLTQKGRIKEAEIPRLPYLQAVVKETMRLHLAVPFLFPHKTQKNVKLNGYSIPKNTQALVNAWAIARDAQFWDNPTCFIPERFLNNELNFKGQHLSFLQFGSGRWICPGIVSLMTASLVYHFEWKLPAGMKPRRIRHEPNFMTHTAEGTTTSCCP